MCSTKGTNLGREGNEAERWYLHSSASNHMMGNREALSELDTSIVGTVKFGDNSSVDIQGRGTFLFHCKSGEHRALTDVYFTPSSAATSSASANWMSEAARC